jgi:hypothetical protein
MRTSLLLVAAVVLLAVPTAALADGGSTSSTGVAKRLAAKKAKKAKKLHVELKRGKTGTIGLRRTAKRELEGTVTSLSPLTVTSAKQGVAPLTCDVPAGVSLAGLQLGDRVEVTCDLVGDRWALRKLEQKDHASAGAPGSTQGPTAACDDDEDDDSGKLDDHDDDCGQPGDDEDDGEDDD